MLDPIILSIEQRNSIFAAMNTRFNTEELKTILFTLDINHENIPHRTKNEFMRGIIDHCERHGLVNGLIQACQKANKKFQLDIPTLALEIDSKINDAIRDFSSVIEDRTEDFTGRTYLLQQIDQFLEKCRGNGGGYVRISGEPGIGKSAFAAHLVKTQNRVHHFNIRQEGDNKTIGMLQNLSAQIISRYKLELSLFKDGNLDPPSFREILEKVSKSGLLTITEPLMIVVDALDEIEDTPSTFNTGGLPQYLPQNVFFVVTHRQDDPKLKLDVANSYDEMIRNNATWHSEDVKKYLAHMCNKPNLNDFINKAGLQKKDFISIMSDKSENNFMYLKYILRDIINRKGESFDSKKLPQGLKDYYKDHFERIKKSNKETWHRYVLPILAILSDRTIPVTLEFIESVMQLQNDANIGAVIKNMKHFLRQEESYIDNNSIVTYKIYHQSFQDYLKTDEEVQSQKGIIGANKRKNRIEQWKRISTPTST